MIVWVKKFIEEIDRIEAFYIKMQKEYEEQFNVLKERFIKKKLNEQFGDGELEYDMQMEELNLMV